MQVHQGDVYSAYKAAKERWLLENPGVTAEQIERECQRIAERLGL